MEISWIQIILLTLYAGYQILDELTIYSSMGSPVFAGLISGVIMNDMVAGLKIGGQMQLMVLGVGTFGGASRIDANSGTVLATAFSVGLKMDPEQAIAVIAVPVASLMIQLDILGRFTNTFFAHRIDRAIERFDYKAIERNFLMGALPWALSRAIPVFLALAIGGDFVNTVVTYLNTDLKWLGDGLAVAGAVLPAVGFAILLRSLPVKKHFQYLILGFTLTGLLSVLFGTVKNLTGLVPDSGAFNNLPMLAIALFGLVIAVNSYHREISGPKTVVAKSDSAEGEIEDDEI